MAPTKTPSTFNALFFFLFFILILFSICHSSLVYSLPQKQEENQQFQVLNVAASIHKTLQLFSKTTPPSPTITAAASAANSSVFSVSLHPRISVVKPHHQNYSALTISRLAYDSARVNSINYKLQLSISQTVHQRLIQPEDLQSPVTSGESQGTFEYLARVGLGRPVKEFFMSIDTGSDVSWLQCQPCDFCYQQSDPIFNSSGSSTFNTLSCSSRECNSLKINGCTDDMCHYYVSYGDGSFTSGDFGTETVTFGRSGSVSNVAVGCGHDNEGLFSGSAGLIGLGVGSLSFPSQIKATSFSYCLVDMDSHSSSTLEFNSTPPSGSIIIPMVYNPKFDIYFYVDLVGISVAGAKLPIQPSVFQVESDGTGGVMVDSGTIVTRLVPPAYESLRDTFAKHAKNLHPTSGYSLFDTCYDLSSIPDEVEVPTVSFHFSGGKTWLLKSKNCLIPVDSRGKFCFAFAPSDSISIIGNIQQQETRISYDLAKKLIGVSPAKC
ncbi:protein ASPARTIC PROTEASE IN GUARD CELL 1-like [Coffea eugenioides]|uniref:protein ASPARTIC PROTEASE IN GUARD CELL 1-like n=1 Tax=Coffea eugenioides TaxID=49369 RepID=UPI000F615E36|nr:protein ASPARTIC PROTEASE IN GUARD CELL 1-like [Coffea eugenioides]